MIDTRKQRIEFGDFQTPRNLAQLVCAKLSSIGISPNVVIEPTCGIGAFVMAAAAEFRSASEIHGFEINEEYLDRLRISLSVTPDADKVRLTKADFFETDWKSVMKKIPGSVLVLGNFPWVTSATQGSIGGNNLPEKSNFLNRNGFDAISGKSNFDISEWMLLEVLRWFGRRSGDIAMLVKMSVARKILAHIERQKIPISEASIFCIDAKKEFNASVDACLLVVRLSDSTSNTNYDYSIFKSITDSCGHRVGHREGLTVGDLDAFESSSYLLGECPKRWRSGVKHDASAVMELTRTKYGLKNGFNEIVDIEDDYLFPLLKGSDIGSGKSWREKFVLVTQHFVGERTDMIREIAPKTWGYLETHAFSLDSRGSAIYKKNPRYSIFGVGDYAFRPWRIAICGLYKNLKFRLVAPIDNKPVMFDDTVYYISFEYESEARETLDLLVSVPSIQLLSSLIFWDEKRPIKTGILNVIDWSRLGENPRQSPQLEINLTNHSNARR